MPAWMQADGAWIAWGVTAITIIAAIIMHRVIRKVLRTPPPDSPEDLDRN